MLRVNDASLPLLLKQLNLSSFGQHYKEQAKVAEDNNLTYLQYLHILSEYEVNSRREKRIKRHLKESNLPVGKTLDSFDFKSSTSVNAAQISALANSTDWLKNGGNVLLFGASGVGKTHLACAIGYRLIEQGLRVLFMSASKMVQKLQQEKTQLKLSDYLIKLSRIPLIILDDIGYVKKDEQETSVLFELIADRYENTSLIITSNQAFDNWDQIFPDSTMAVAAIDRLVHRSTVINIEGESFRKNNRQQCVEIGG